MLELLHHFFQVLPVVLACVAAVLCSMRYSKDRRRSDRFALVLGTLSSVMLIVAQTSWWTTFLIEGSLQGTMFANVIWTIFNSASMITFILFSTPRRK